MLTGPEREEAKQRLQEIAEQLQRAFEQEAMMRAHIQRLRDEQRKLNGKVYSA